MQKGYSPEDGYTPQQYWDGLLDQQFDESGVAYQQLAPSFSRAMYDALESATTAFLRANGLGGPPGRVLDIGSGTGVWIDYWRARGAASISGLDLTPVAVDGLRKAYPGLTFDCVDIGEAGFDRRGAFDVVSAMSVLLHIVDDARWRQALRNISESLVPGGHAVLIEPVLRHGWNGPAFNDASNSRARLLSDYREAADAAGLDVVDVQPATVVLANPIDSRSRVTHALMEKAWHALNAAVGTSDGRGRAIGSALKAIDPSLRRVFPHGPSAKLLLLRARG